MKLSISLIILILFLLGGSAVAKNGAVMKRDLAMIDRPKMVCIASIRCSTDKGELRLLELSSTCPESDVNYCRVWPASDKAILAPGERVEIRCGTSSADWGKEREEHFIPSHFMGERMKCELLGARLSPFN